MIKNYSTKILRHNECGAMTLFLSVIVFPLLLVGFFLSLDLRYYFASSEDIQAGLDSAALKAFRYLPYQDRTEAAVKNFLSSQDPVLFGAHAEKVNVAVRGDTIDLTYLGSLNLSFGPLLQMISQGSEESVRLFAYSKVKATAFDALIALDLSNYMAPATGEDLWGQDSKDTIWPAALFFRNDYILMQDGMPLDPLRSTQNCFNPAVSALKRAALSTYQYLSNFDHDQVGFAVYPGLAPLDSFRQVLPRNADAASNASYNDTGAESRLLTYYSNFHSDVYCAAAAERENVAMHYQFPSFSPLADWKPSSGSPPSSMVSPGFNSFDSNYDPFVSVTKAVWSSVVRTSKPTDFPELLTSLSSELLGSASLTSRVGLTTHPLKYGLIFAGNLPYAAGARWTKEDTNGGPIRKAIQDLYAQITKEDFKQYDFKLKIIYSVFDHPGTKKDPVAPHINALQDLFDKETKDFNGKLSFQVLYAKTPEALERDLVTLLLLRDKTPVLAK